MTVSEYFKTIRNYSYVAILRKYLPFRFGAKNSNLKNKFYYFYQFTRKLCCSLFPLFLPLCFGGHHWNYSSRHFEQLSIGEDSLGQFFCLCLTCVCHLLNLEQKMRPINSSFFDICSLSVVQLDKFSGRRNAIWNWKLSRTVVLCIQLLVSSH